MTRTLLDDCFQHDERRLSHQEALDLLRARVGPVAGLERVQLAEAHGRILAADVAAPHPVPAHTNAAVDGYAFAHAGHSASPDQPLRIAARAAAGHPHAGVIAAGSAARIFTGAVLPAGCDTVAMQEDVQLVGAAGADAVIVPKGLKRGANVRAAGEDVAAGERLLEAGDVLRPQDLAALASIGFGDVACYRPLRVAIVSSGDEVVAPGAPLAEGQVYDANAPMLEALVTAGGGKVTHLGILPDRPDVIRRALVDAAREYDIILASGGASRGDEDHLVAALEAIGKRHLWQIAVKPGRPLSFGQIGNCAMVGLPGNPVAVFVCALLYVRPLLRRLGGGRWSEPRRYPLPAAFDFKGRKTGRREFWRGRLVDRAQGLAVDKFRRDGSGLISGLRAADGLIDIAEERGDIAEGDRVDFIPFSEFGLASRS